MSYHFIHEDIFKKRVDQRKVFFFNLYRELFNAMKFNQKINNPIFFFIFMISLVTEPLPQKSHQSSSPVNFRQSLSPSEM